jgi:integrase
VRLYKRSKTWWFSLEFEGKRYQKTTREKNRVKAEGIASAFRTALAHRRVGIIERKPVPLLADAMKSFLNWSKTEHKDHPATYQRYRTSSKPLLAYLKFKGKPIDEITPATIEDYKAHRGRQTGKHTKRPIKPATINRELACLKAMYFHAAKGGHDFRNPLSKKLVGNEAVKFLNENNEQNRVLTFEEQQKYLSAANDNLKDVATMILETGMRPEEVYRIRIENVFPDQSYLFNPFGKTKAAKRNIPLNAMALAIITKRMKAAKGVYLFPHRKDADKPMLKANNAHDAALKKSKVRKFRLYDLRHTWATRAAEAGMDVGTLASLLGHSKLVMVMRYVHPGEAHRVDAVKKLEVFNAARQIAEFEKKNQVQESPLQFPLQSKTSPQREPL